MLDEFTIACPWCGEPFVALVDTSIDNQTYVEDCQICCQPVLFEVRLDTISGEVTLQTRREND